MSRVEAARVLHFRNPACSSFCKGVVRRGFTLVEMLAAMSVLLLIMFILFSFIDQTGKVWRNTGGKIEQFKEVRRALDSMTRRLSQAVLNPYLDCEYPLDASGNPDTSRPPTRYVRQSELRFISGSAEELLGSTPYRPTQAVFFQAPLGYTDNSSYKAFGNLLNTWGYYVEFGDDLDHRPDFITEAVLPKRHRFRLKEMMEPTENLTLYQFTSGKQGASQSARNLSYITNPPLTGLAQPAGITPLDEDPTGKKWFTVPMEPARKYSRTLAENVVALILHPKLPLEEAAEAGADLAPHYNYDSSAVSATPVLNPKNQLPPLMQVTIVAIDEASAARLDRGATPPDLGLAGLFKESSKFDEDLEKLASTLSSRKVNYRVFTTSLRMKGAKWSREQGN